MTVVAAALAESRMQINTDAPRFPHMSPMPPDLQTQNNEEIKEDEEEEEEEEELPPLSSQSRFELLQLSEIPHVQASLQSPTRQPASPLPHAHQVRHQAHMPEPSL